MAKRAAKKSVKRTARSVQPDEMEVRRFCIEMGQRWPVIVEHRGMSGMAQYGNAADTTRDADVIGRAEKIYAWLTRE